MPWFKVDDDLAFHRKIVAAGNAATGLWVRSGSWSAQQLTDGFIPSHMVPLLGTAAQAARLVKVGLWLEVDGGFQFHQWNENGRQPTSESVRAQREKSAERQAKWRAAKSANSQVSGVRNGVTPPLVTPSVTPSVTGAPTRPDPVVTTTATADAAPKIDSRFDEWWSHYPRKVKKDDARKAWTAVLRKKVDPDLLVQALHRHVAAWRAEGKDTQYIPYPASWLRGGSYDDELEQARLSLVPAAPEFRSFDDIRANAAAGEAARLLGIACILREQPPTDRTPRAEFIHRARVEWIEAHEQEIRAALTERKTG